MTRLKDQTGLRKAIGQWELMHDIPPKPKQPDDSIVFVHIDVSAELRKLEAGEPTGELPPLVESLEADLPWVDDDDNAAGELRHVPFNLESLPWTDVEAEELQTAFYTQDIAESEESVESPEWGRFVRIVSVNQLSIVGMGRKSVLRWKPTGTVRIADSGIPSFVPTNAAFVDDRVLFDDCVKPHDPPLPPVWEYNNCEHVRKVVDNVMAIRQFLESQRQPPAKPQGRLIASPAFNWSVWEESDDVCQLVANPEDGQHESAWLRSVRLLVR